MAVNCGLKSPLACIKLLTQITPHKSLATVIWHSSQSGGVGYEWFVLKPLVPLTGAGHGHRRPIGSGDD